MKPRETMDLAGALDERPEQGILRVDRSIFTDPDLFELEMTQIWEKTWLFICHESQVAEPHDFITTHMGRQPVVVTRNGQGEVRVFINACAHRGVQLVREVEGNRPDFTCFFHGWCYDTNGELKSVTKESIGGYPDQFDKANYGLTAVPRVENYRGFVFASLSDDVPTLDEHLGDARVMIDLLADQAEDGWEVLRGVSTYTYNGNWKLQAENGVDGYHVHQAHLNFALTTQNRDQLRAASAGATKSMQVGNLGTKGLNGGFFAFGNGHTMLWGDWPNKGDRRPNFHRWQEWSEKFGEKRTEWMIGKLRNLLLYPNVFLMDQMSTQIRIFRPLAVDKTEVTVYALAPKNEAPQWRRHRIRQYEDFFNASGMATPDDLAEFTYSQKGYLGALARWNDMTRGLKHLTKGANEFARELDLKVESSGGRVEDEGIFVAQHEHWLRMMSGK